MLDRATVIDENFIQFVTNERLPEPVSHTSMEEAGLDKNTLLDLFESQLISRHLDLAARRLKQKQCVYYTIGSSGHEGNAAIGHVFRQTDMAFLHYRSCALVVQRMKTLPQLNIIKDLFLSFAASSNDPISAGRHKVFGSVPLFIPPQTSTIASHLPKSVGAALSITRAKELNIDAPLPEDTVLLCSFGDASVNHAAAQTAFNAAQWIAYNGYPLPLIFICEDNGLGISVPTPPQWIEDIMSHRVGIHYLQADGLNLVDVYRAAQQAEHYAREKKQPVFLHMKCVRLMGHAGTDIESVYLTQKQIEENEFQDPLLHTARFLLDNKLLAKDEIIAQYKKTRERVDKEAETIINLPKLSSAEEVMRSIIPTPLKKKSLPLPNETERKKIFGDQYAYLSKPRNLSQQLNYALTDILLQYDNTLIFGEDVAKKGGVYHVTADLVKRFGQRRVFDTLLDETTILGTAVGLAHNGFIPIPEIQFLAYLHNAEDQLRGEAATLSFFSNGQYANPMIIRIASFAYQKGFGGHFHNDNSIAVLRDIPGLIIACPSQGSDAAKMLRTCVALARQEGRVIAFLEPIALYMTKDLHEAGDNAWLSPYPDPNETISLDEVGVYGESNDLAIITYANGYYLSRQAEKILKEQHDVNIKIIDIRWLAPLPQAAILKHIKGCKNVLIVDECRQTGSLSESLVTMIIENVEKPPRIKRVTGLDTFIPLGDAWKYVLPSKDDIIQVCLQP